MKGRIQSLKEEVSESGKAESGKADLRAWERRFKSLEEEIS